jgi:hypothetical protein
MNTYLSMTKNELIHYFGKTREEAEQLIQNYKYFKNPNSYPLQAEHYTWGILLMTEHMKTTS